MEAEGVVMISVDWSEHAIVLAAEAHVALLVFTARLASRVKKLMRGDKIIFQV